MDHKKVEFPVALNIFRNIADEVYTAEDPEVQQYIKAFYQKQYTRSRGGKKHMVISKPVAAPGRSMLARVLRDGVYSVQRFGAAKQRDEAAEVQEGDAIFGMEVQGGEELQAAEEEQRAEHIQPLSAPCQSTQS